LVFLQCSIVYGQPAKGVIREYLLDLDISIVKKAQAPVYMLKRTRDDQRQTDTDDFRIILEEKIDDAHLESVGGVVEFSELSKSTRWNGFRDRGLTLVYYGNILNEESTKMVPHTYPIATLLVNYEGLIAPNARQYQKKSKFQVHPVLGSS
jgi:hypothetical protein